MIQLIGTRWLLKNFGVDLKDKEIEFRSNGELYTCKDTSITSKWSVNNSILTINYNKGYVAYTGTINNKIITGKAINIVGDSWTFKAELIEISSPSEPSPERHEEIIPTQKQKGEFIYYYYFAYYPTRFTVSEELKKVRKIIWNFKDGKSSKEIASAFCEDLEHLNLETPLTKWWLCVIPASTKEKTELRFKTFCEKYCELTKINNGYSLIINKADRNAVHLQEVRGSVNILDSIDFANVKGKSILLFDDIYTTGKSFLKVARRLKALGANDVIGLFLGKTHWIEEESLTSEDIEEI